MNIITIYYTPKQEKQTKHLIEIMSMLKGTNHYTTNSNYYTQIIHVALLE